MLDPSEPLPDISAEEPAGPNLEFDAAFTEFERTAQGKPEQQYGSTIVPAEEPDWREVIGGAWALLERTYDLRVFAQLAAARLNREGLQGYTDTMALIRQVLETRWEKVHPQLDPEDDNDPTLRANALLTVAEPGRVLRVLRAAPLARGPRAGVVCWRDIAITTGLIDVPEGTPKMPETTITGAFRETDAAWLAGTREAVSTAVGHAVAIGAAFDEFAGYGFSPDFSELLKLLREMQRMITTYAPAGDVAEPAADLVEAGEPVEGQVTAAGPVRAGVVGVSSLGAITTRGDAMRLLDLVVEYYERCEPSSPLPLLIGRARRLSDKGFLDLLRDLAPDGLGQMERIAGAPE